jgi:restriction alleviation protein Lar
MRSELKPCPFCNGKATLSPEIYSDENPSEVIGPAGVKCDDCGALVWGDWSDDAIAA